MSALWAKTIVADGWQVRLSAEYASPLPLLLIRATKGQQIYNDAADALYKLVEKAPFTIPEDVQTQMRDKAVTVAMMMCAARTI